MRAVLQANVRANTSTPRSPCLTSALPLLTLSSVTSLPKRAESSLVAAAGAAPSGRGSTCFGLFEAPHSARTSACADQISSRLAVHNAGSDRVGVRLVRVSASATSVALNRVGVLNGMRGLVSCDEQARALAGKPNVAAKREPLRTELSRRVDSFVWAPAASG